LEREIAELKRRVEKLEAKARPVAKDTWRDAIGTSQGDEMDREAARLGAVYRAQQNQLP
jgi:hypothetical protein